MKTKEFVYNPNKYFGYRRRYGQAYNPRVVREEEKRKEKMYGHKRCS